MGREYIVMSMFVDITSDKEPGESTVGKALGEPCGLTNLPSRQAVLVLVEQGHNDATALLYISA
jgi:hypothetical protein